MRRNKFLAKPEGYSGPTMGGVHEYPGFHTASNEETTYSYAHAKARPSYEDADTVHDIPVVIELDMRGLNRLPDFDAMKSVKPRLKDLLSEIYTDLKCSHKASKKEGPLDILHGMVDFGQEQEMPDEVDEFLFQVGAHVIEDPSASLLSVAEDKDDPDGFLYDLIVKGIDEETLIEVTGQFRYEEDVDSSRIVEINYMSPWWPKIVGVDESDKESEKMSLEFIDMLEKKGWSVITLEDIYNFHIPVSYSKKINGPAKKLRKHRSEFHGTSYLNLVKAAKELSLPVPSSPFVPE